MIDFSGLPRSSFLGRFLRRSLEFIPRDLQVPILQGKLRGTRWVVGSGVHGYWLGSYEKEEQLLFTSVIKRGSIVYDIGANVGFYSLLAAKMVGPQGMVIAFEPLPRNLEYLRRHVVMNRFSNIIKVLPYAVSNRAGFGNLDPSENPSQSKLRANGSIQVETCKLDEVVMNLLLPYPQVVKVDVEGAEEDVLLGGEVLLTRLHPILFLSVHSDDLKTKCSAILGEYGYSIRFILSRRAEGSRELIALPNHIMAAKERPAEFSSERRA